MNEELVNNIQKLIGGDPTKDNVNYMRTRLSDLLDETSSMTIGHIGTKEISEDLVVIFPENNLLHLVETTLDGLIDYQINNL